VFIAWSKVKIMFTENKVGGRFFGTSNIDLNHVGQDYSSYNHRDSLTLYSVSEIQFSFF